MSDMLEPRPVADATDPKLAAREPELAATADDWLPIAVRRVGQLLAVGMGAMLLVTLAAMGGVAVRPLAQELSFVALFVSFAALWLNARGSSKLAALLLTAIPLMGPIAIQWWQANFNQPLTGSVLAIAMAGLFFGARGAFSIVIVTLVNETLLLSTHWDTLGPTFDGRSLPGVVMARSINGLLTAAIMSLIYREIEARRRAQFETIARLRAEIAARREAHEALVASEERFRTLVECVPVGVATFSRDLEVTAINPAIRALFGATRGPIVGVNLKDSPMFQVASVTQGFKTALDDGKSSVFEVQATTRSNQRVELQVHLAPVLASDGSIDGVVAAIVDMAERRRLDVEREATLRELGLRNAEMERFLYTVSHDLKSPLITIAGFAGLVRDDLRTQDLASAERGVQEIHSAATRMNALLDDLLELSRIGRVVNPPQPMLAGALFREVCELLAGRIAETGAVISLSGEQVELFGDRVRMAEALQNLVENALKFIRAGEVPRVELGAKESETETRLFVRDSGIGIRADYLEKVFELFQRLDSERDGTGVGLTLVRRITEAHGGRAWAESAGADRGTTFWIALPRAPRAETLR